LGEKASTGGKEYSNTWSDTTSEATNSLFTHLCVILAARACCWCVILMGYNCLEMMGYCSAGDGCGDVFEDKISIGDDDDP
jgi:hypothetical protein